MQNVASIPTPALPPPMALAAPRLWRQIALGWAFQGSCSRGNVLYLAAQGRVDYQGAGWL